MFASLRNKFSIYRTSLLLFDLEENIIIEAFASVTLSFAFDVSESFYTIEACAVPGGVYTTWSRAAPGRVCTTDECTAPGGVCHRA